jgi:hypothetical protein
VPKDDGFWVTFTNMTDLAAEPGAAQYCLGTYQEARSAAEALDAAIPWALGVMSRVGLPPHGIRIGAEELRTQASVLPDREVFYDGLAVALKRHRQQ